MFGFGRNHSPWIPPGGYQAPDDLSDLPWHFRVVLWLPLRVLRWFERETREGNAGRA